MWNNYFLFHLILSSVFHMFDVIIHFGLPLPDFLLQNTTFSCPRRLNYKACWHNPILVIIQVRIKIGIIKTIIFNPCYHSLIPFPTIAGISCRNRPFTISTSYSTLGWASVQFPRYHKDLLPTSKYCPSCLRLSVMEPLSVPLSPQNYSVGLLAC